MGIDDSCNTGLVLGLSLTPSNNYNHGVKKPSSQNLEPSLTLGLNTENSYCNNKKLEEFSSAPAAGGGDQLCRQTSSHSGVSSFSSGRVIKREREMKKEDEEEDEDGDGVSTRKKLRLTKEQSVLLEQCFKQHSTLNPKQKQAMAKQLNLRPRQVEVWFQNRRARTKLKQTEVDCEFLKKCCETLTEENRRLQKEVQDLKALKLAQLPFYMPAATLTMCPSCERIGAGDSAAVGATAVDGGGKIPFNLAAKPHFFNPFSNPSSAAC